MSRRQGIKGNKDKSPGRCGGPHARPRPKPPSQRRTGSCQSELQIRATQGEFEGEATMGRKQKRFDMHWVIGTGWIHTHGMAERGFPEVEVRHVPDFLAES